jgi:predicted ester cyclase
MARTGDAGTHWLAGRCADRWPTSENGTQGGHTMSVQDNAAAYRRWFDEGCSQGNIGVADELYSPDYVSHSLPPDLPPTRDGLKLFISALREGLPDLQCPVEDVVAEGDRVAGRFSLRGTHTGTLLGVPATGKRVDVGVMVIGRFDASARWVEDWNSWDQLGLLQQIGVIPAPTAV